MPLVGPDKSTFDDLTAAERAALEAAKYYQDWDSGYSKQQSTRPQTLGYGLVDSPAGQAAWIVEKFWSWMDCDGHPENVLTRDELLDNVMLYWLPATAASSARLYWESFAKQTNTLTGQVEVKAGCSIFPKEIFRTSRRWAEKRFGELLHWNELDKGGHFAAFEQPEVFVNEVRTCFRSLR
jgi:pimeloyl-ACP methyl ester carboxylesterase